MGVEYELVLRVKGPIDHFLIYGPGRRHGFERSGLGNKRQLPEIDPVDIRVDFRYRGLPPR